MHPICFFKTLWRSFRAGAWMMGHDYATIKEKTPPNVHVIECSVCGDVSTAWSWDSMEAQK